MHYCCSCLPIFINSRYFNRISFYRRSLNRRSINRKYFNRKSFNGISLNGIDLNIINLLIIKLDRSKYIKHLDNINQDIDPYSFLYPNKIMDKQIILDLDKKYPMLHEIREDMYDILINNPYYLPLQVREVLEDIYDTLLNSSSRILDKNNTLILPTKDKHKIKIEKWLDWYGYNTPSIKSLHVTPLHGTDYLKRINNKSSSDIYDQWKVSTFMLILEYNYLKKAWIFLNNEKLKVLSNDYKKSYDFWKNRQIFMLYINDNFFLDKTSDPIYIPPLWLDGDCINREISEDILYVLLNILLGKSILTNPELNKNINNDKLFFNILEAIITKHYQKYSIEYQCLYDLRKYKLYNFMSLNQLNLIN